MPDQPYQYTPGNKFFKDLMGYHVPEETKAILGKILKTTGTVLAPGLAIGLNKLQNSDLPKIFSGYNEGKILNDDFRDWLKVNAKTQKQRDLLLLNEQEPAITGQFNINRLIGNKDYMQWRGELDRQLAELDHVEITDEDLFSPNMKKRVNDEYRNYYREVVGAAQGLDSAQRGNYGRAEAEPTYQDPRKAAYVKRYQEMRAQFEGSGLAQSGQPLHPMLQQIADKK